MTEKSSENDAKPRKSRKRVRKRSKDIALPARGEYIKSESENL